MTEGRRHVVMLLQMGVGCGYRQIERGSRLFMLYYALVNSATFGRRVPMHHTLHTLPNGCVLLCTVQPTDTLLCVCVCITGQHPLEGARPACPRGEHDPALREAEGGLVDTGGGLCEHGDASLSIEQCLGVDGCLGRLHTCMQLHHKLRCSLLFWMYALAGQGAGS